MILLAVALLLFVLAFPLGFAIAYLARDELIAGRKWFLALMAVSLIFGVYFAYLGNYPVSISLAFIFIVTLVSFIKSKDKKFTGKKFK